MYCSRFIIIVSLENVHEFRKQRSPCTFQYKGKEQGSLNVATSHLRHFNASALHVLAELLVVKYWTDAKVDYDVGYISVCLVLLMPV